MQEINNKWGESCTSSLPKKYEGSSKAMELDAVLELTTRIYMKYHIMAEEIVAGNGNTIKVVVRSLYEEKYKYKDLFSLWSQSLMIEGQKKTSICKLSLHISEQVWLVDSIQ
eukprot:9774556-Ditylum_brightwellii.AAC.1